MTRNEFLDFLRTDPVFKVADKQVVATLYESPFDNVSLDAEAGSITITLHGEDFTFEPDDADLGEIMLENPYLQIVIPAKRVIINTGFRTTGNLHYIDANGSVVTGGAVIPFPTPGDDGEDDGGNDGGVS